MKVCKEPMNKITIIISLILAIVLVGCTTISPPPPVPQAPVPAVPAPAPAPEPTPLPQPEPTAEPEPDVETTQALVTRVIDGDTVEVEIDDSLYKVRYIGIDTPEVGQPCADEATEINRQLVEGKVVRLEKDISETDKYGRLLRYVYVDVEYTLPDIDISKYGTSLEEMRRLAQDFQDALQHGERIQQRIFINAELVRLGYAQVFSYPPDVKYQDYFLELQTEARDAGSGCWGITQESEEVDEAVEFFIDVVFLTSPVSPGEYATIEVKTLPNELLGIEVHYKSGKSEAAGLVPKRADDEGNVWWTWKVGTRTTPGRWEIVIASLNMDWWFKGYENITKTVYFEVK